MGPFFIPSIKSIRSERVHNLITLAMVLCFVYAGSAGLYWTESSYKSTGMD